ncbi:ASPIC and UnbV [Luteitalea pratensis]|uniref:ASPIC and UnbV n=1 Tax=Luteitalea pratensis TaxID=1855912 RepID=A0A143PLA7_LUTPR|nr:CRTAC1 family protein [Luteitalea pratensis]AMY09372.1 ASPIC and UnbV [Luteitalea pratensis]
MVPLATLSLAGLVLAASLSIWSSVAADDEWPVHLVDRAADAGLTRPSIYGGVDRKRFILEANGAGVALIDVDDDGWLDALVLSGTRLREDARTAITWPAGEAPTARLYRNRRDGTFEDVTRGSGLDRKVGWASGVCAGDYDNDGRLDLFVTYYGHNLLYRNMGGGRFEDHTDARGLGGKADRWGSGCTFIDYDADGRLDLFVANYLTFSLDTAPNPGEGPNCAWRGVSVNCGPKGLPAETNLLYRNTGSSFVDVSDGSGVSRVSGRYSMSAIAADLDGDDDVDIYVAADSTAAILYRNNGDRTFTDVALESGAAYNALGAPQAGMGLGVADVNADGRLDLVKTHFADDIPALYQALGRGLFEDVALPAGLAVENRFVQWGVGLPDLDNDGWPDLLYVTGNVYPEVEARLPQYPHRSPRVVFRNRGDGRFEHISALSGPGVAAAHSSRGAAFGDVDNDGDIDVLVMNMNEPPSLLINTARVKHAWIGVRLRGTAANRRGLGSTIRVTAGGRTQSRVVLSQSSYYSHDELAVHVGLGGVTQADRVEVRWPGGDVTVVEALPANRMHEIAQLPAGARSRR